jgi:hypothetical protein
MLMAPILADVVWPALILAGRLSVWWCIGASLILEAVVLWWFMRMRPLKAAAASIVMNLVSALLGSLLLPMIGLSWESLADQTYKVWFGWGTFNWITQIATWLLAVLLSTAIETFVLWLLFYMPWTRRLIVVMLAANAVTVGMAWITTLLFARR